MSSHLIHLWTWLWDHLFFINVLLSIFIIFFQRRDPKAVWTWLLALNFIPIFGIFFYLLLGQDYQKSKMFRIKGVEDAQKYEAKRQENLLRQNVQLVKDVYARDYEKLIYYNLNAGNSILTLKNQVEIFKDGNEKFNDLIGELENAKRYIHIQYYIIKDDYLFDRISKVLIKKANEGVKVRVLCDGMGGRFMPRAKWNTLKATGVKIGIFFPPTLGRINLRVNYRNHRKLVVIDGAVGYVGGFNIGKEYVDGDPKFGHWRDTHLKIRGESVFSLEVRFALDWHFTTKESLFESEYFEYKPLEQKSGDFAGIQIVTSGPDSKTKLIRDNYIELFRMARHHIYIHTPYFVPDDAVMSALCFAARSGVDVRLMIPSFPDHPFVYWASTSWAASLLLAGGRVYTYQKGFLHAKSVMVDGRCASVGTANMDIRSFELNFEVNATIYHEATVEVLEKNFLADIQDCREMTCTDYENRGIVRGIVQRVKEQVSRLLSPLL